MVTEQFVLVIPEHGPVPGSPGLVQGTPAELLITIWSLPPVEDRVLDHGHQPELKLGIWAWKFCKCAYRWPYFRNFTCAREVRASGVTSVGPVASALTEVPGPDPELELRLMSMVEYSTLHRRQRPYQKASSTVLGEPKSGR